MIRKATVMLGLTLMGSQWVQAQSNKNNIEIIDEAVKSKAIAADTSKKKNWKFGGTVGFAFTQQNSSYWIGVSESFALNVGLNVDLYGNGAWGKNSWDNTFKASYAYQNNQSQGFRKSADFFDLYSKYGRNLNQKKTLNAAFIMNFRSQFTDGFDYDKSPRRRISGFMAPGRLLLTPGIDWRPKEYFSLFFSPVAAKWIFFTNDPFSYSTNPPPPDEKPISESHGVDPYEKVDAQFGAFVSMSFNKEIMKNVKYTSRLDFYSNYLNNPENIDIFWTNTLTFKVNKWLALGYNWNVAYDDEYIPSGETGPRTQYLGVFSIGVTAKF
jgi:hypothetical protein